MLGSISPAVRTFPPGDGCIDHPFVRSNASGLISVCGPPGWKMYSYLLLFISVSPEFVPVEVTQGVTLNEDIDPVQVYLRGGF